MVRAKEWVGRKFGKWTVTEDLGTHRSKPNSRPRRRVKVKCECGYTSVKRIENIAYGGSKQCVSCQHKFSDAVTHGMSNTKVYKAWQHIKWRVTNPNYSLYHAYGGRGITMCKRWEVFENFYEDMGDPPNSSYSVDRIDVDGNYCPENCRWATPKQQARNKQNTRWIEGKSLAEWEEITGIPHQYISYHADRDRSIESIVVRWNKKEEKKLLQNKTET